MNLKEFIHSEIRNTLLESVNEDRVNDFFYIELKKKMWNRRKDYSNKISKLNGLEKTEYLEDLYIKLNGPFARDIKGHGMDLYKRLVNDKVIKEDTELDQAFLKAKPVEEETKRDYKKEYEKYGKSKKAKKYRAELNKYNRQKGTYGNGDGKDASHKGGKIVGFEDESKNRGRREKSRLKKEATFVPVSGTKAGGTLHLDRRKYQLKKDVKDVQIGNYIVTLPKGTILYNLAGGVLADHKSLEQYETRNQKYFKKPTYRGIMIRQKEQTIRDIEKNSKVLESVNEGKSHAIRDDKGRPFLLIVGEEPKDSKGKSEYKKNGFYISPQKGFKGLITAYFKDDKTLKKNIDKKYHKQLGESVNEGMVEPRRGHNYYQLIKAAPVKYIESQSNPFGATGVLLHNKDGYIKGVKGAYIIDYFGAHFYVDLKSKFATPIYGLKDQRELRKAIQSVGMAPEHSDWKKYVKEIPLKNESTINEEQLDEKLITFSNRAAYGQIVFMAGGAGSGKGFAIDNFIDGAGFKVRDVDEMKKQLGKLDQLGKFSVDKWYKKFGKNLSTKPPKKNPKGMSPKEHIEEFVLGKGLSISDISKDLKNPNNVASLHYIVDAMKLKDKWLISMLSGKDNKETLPNLLFDITAKKVASITDVLTPLLNAGYDSKNIHLIWVLTNYHIAVDRNKDRDRVVPDDILLQTHEGAGKTMWTLLTKALPKGLNGRVDVILNNQENTIYHIQPTTRKGKKVGVVSNFLSLPIKKQGGGIIPEKIWKSKLYAWIRNNAPKTLDIDQTINKDEEYMI